MGEDITRGQNKPMKCCEQFLFWPITNAVRNVYTNIRTYIQKETLTNVHRLVYDEILYGMHCVAPQDFRCHSATLQGCLQVFYKLPNCSIQRSISFRILKIQHCGFLHSKRKIMLYTVSYRNF